MFFNDVLIYRNSNINILIFDFRRSLKGEKKCLDIFFMFELITYNLFYFYGKKNHRANFAWAKSICAMCFNIQWSSKLSNQINELSFSNLCENVNSIQSTSYRSLINSIIRIFQSTHSLSFTEMYIYDS